MADDILARYYGDKDSLREPMLERVRQTTPWPTLEPLPDNRPSLRPTQQIGDPFSREVSKYAGPNAVLESAYGLGDIGGKALLDARYGKIDPETLVPLLGMAMAPGMGKGKAPIPRELDKMGFYSQALEAAKAWPQAKGTAEQALQHLKSNQVKDAEIAATGLPAFLQERPSVTRDDLINHLRENRVGLNEGRYGKPFTEDELRAARTDGGRQFDEQGWIADRSQQAGMKNEAKWADYSLDPSNPSYRESVLHLPNELSAAQKRVRDAAAAPYQPGLAEAHGRYSDYSLTPEQRTAAYDDLRKLQDQAWKAATTAVPDPQPFKSGHWDEPNVMAHLRTSLQKDAEGRPVFLLDELQSDWGQKLRDGGARDEAKIAELNSRVQQADRDIADHWNAGAPLFGYKDSADWTAQAKAKNPKLEPWQVDKAILDQVTKASINNRAPQNIVDWKVKHDQIQNARRLAEAEYHTASAATPGHPLVNTTDQWTTTAMRRLLQQANEAGAEGIAITPGQMQNDRFGLANHVQGLRYDPEMRQLQYIPAENAQYGQFSRHQRAGRGEWRSLDERHGSDQLPALIGKEMAEKLLSQPREYQGVGYSVAGPHTLTDLANADIGGQGMRYAYDQMYPKHLEKILKKLDKEYPGRGETMLQQSHQQPGWPETHPTPFHHFPLTQKIKDEINKGLPLFTAGASAIPLAGTILDQYYGDGKAAGGAITSGPPHLNEDPTFYSLDQDINTPMSTWRPYEPDTEVRGEVLPPDLLYEHYGPKGKLEEKPLPWRPEFDNGGRIANGQPPAMTYSDKRLHEFFPDVSVIGRSPVTAQDAHQADADEADNRRSGIGPLPPDVALEIYNSMRAPYLMPSIPEGSITTNPVTGARVIRRNGQWLPLQK